MVDTVQKTSAQRLKDWIKRNVRRAKREDDERERLQKERELTEELELPLDDEEVEIRIGGVGGMSSAPGGEVGFSSRPRDARLTIVDARDELVLFDALRSPAPRATPTTAAAGGAVADSAKRPLLPQRGEPLTDEFD